MAEDTSSTSGRRRSACSPLAALLLVDRGELDLDAPVALYWPEFAAKGKKDVLVRHLLSHTSGVSGWEPPFSIRDMYDWESSTERLAQQAPWWEPGTASGYHANNQGHLVGEVIRRITNTTFKKFVADRDRRPAGRGLPDRRPRVRGSRIAPVIAPPPPRAATSRRRTRGREDLHRPQGLGRRAANSPEWRAADLGALNGHSTPAGCCACCAR